jgi:phenylglyoxylate dehydrogenase epsilon subunit
LPYLFAGRVEESQFYLRAESYYQEQNARLLLSKRVERVLPEEKKVELAGGEALEYDKLFVATGASPVIPGINGLKEVGYFVFKTLADTKALMSAAKKAKSALVLGGGLVGMDTASGLIKRGLKVTVVEKEARVLPLYFDRESSELIKRIYEENGARLITGQEAIEVVPEKGGREFSLKLSGGETLAAELLVAAVGMAPNLGLAKDSGIEVNRGILVDETMRTNLPDIYAGGDVAEADDFFESGRGRGPVRGRHLL